MEITLIGVTVCACDTVFMDVSKCMCDHDLPRKLLSWQVYSIPPTSHELTSMHVCEKAQCSWRYLPQLPEIHHYWRARNMQSIHLETTSKRNLASRGYKVPVC